jgi:hypothetical protein
MRNIAGSALLAAVALLAVPQAARCDRNVLAPSGRIVAPGDVAALYLFRSSDKGELGRLSVGVPKDDLGLELEIEHLSGDRHSVQTLGMQYSVISEAFTNNLAPALSVGVLDLPNRTDAGRAWYLSLSKTMGLSEQQERVMDTLRIHGGYGSHGIGGAYVGASVRIARRLHLAAELYVRRLNAAARLDVAGPVSVCAQSHQGTRWYGIELRLIR